MTKANLMKTPANEFDVRWFINQIVDLAITDAKDFPHIRRTGDQLCEMFTSECRRGHKRMASSLYNKIRWTFDTNYGG